MNMPSALADQIAAGALYELFKLPPYSSHCGRCRRGPFERDRFGAWPSALSPDKQSWWCRECRAEFGWRAVVWMGEEAEYD